MRNHLLYFGVLAAALSAPFGMASARAQEPAGATQTEAVAVLPDAPLPQQSQQPQQPQQDSQNSSSGSSSSSAQAGQQQAPAQGSSQSSTQQTDQGKYQKAQQQIERQEHQRVLGVVPMFNTTYLGNKTVPLTAGQKIKLAFRTSIDPVTFGEAFLVGGYHEMNNDYPGFSWGAEGYFKRAGAAYADAFDGNMLGNGVFPAVFHQDPRYYRLGHGRILHRAFYAASTAFMCKGDNGKWQPNVSNVGGNILAGYISNYYYPSQNSGWGQTIGDGMLNTVVGMVGGVFQEFWPDISGKVLHRDPTHGAQPQGAGSSQ